MADETQPDDEIIRVQHAIVLQSGKYINALNDLLSVGWRVVSATPMGENVVIIIEHFGTQEVVAELREALGFNDLGEAK
jgi:hypothetical protein